MNFCFLEKTEKEMEIQTEEQDFYNAGDVLRKKILQTINYIYYSPIFCLDTRSLALFRIVIALMHLVDLWIRSMNLKVHYSDYGVWPIDQATFSISSMTYSIHWMNGTVTFQFVTFVIHAVMAISLLVGYKTTVSSILLYVLQTSLHNRNHLLQNGGDDFWRCISLWCVFLPLGAKFSVDNILENLHTRYKTQASPTQYSSMFCILFITQFGWLYWGAAITKTGKEWTTEHSAVYYALSIDIFTTRFAKHFLIGQLSMEFLQLLSWLTVRLEFALPFLFFFPTRILNSISRTVAILFIFSIHAGFGLALELGLFPLIPPIVALALLPAWFWDHVIYKRILLKYWEPVAVIIPRNQLVNKNYFTLYCMQFLLVQPSEIYYSEDSSEFEVIGRFTQTRMVGEKSLLRFSPFTSWYFRLVSWFKKNNSTNNAVIPIYNNTTQKSINNDNKEQTNYTTSRENISKPQPEYFKKHLTITQFLLEILAFILVCYVIWLNLGNAQLLEVHSPVRAPASFFRFDQFWYLFSPFPMKDDGWWVVEGHLEHSETFSSSEELVKQTTVDLWRYFVLSDGMHQVNWTKPNHVAGLYPDQRWRRYMMALWNNDNKWMREYLTRWMCRNWNGYSYKQLQRRRRSCKIQ